MGGGTKAVGRRRTKAVVDPTREGGGWTKAVVEDPTREGGGRTKAVVEDPTREGGGETKMGDPTREEMLRFSDLPRKKVFTCLERIKGGKILNILRGLELHTGVFSAVEQERIVDFVHKMQRKGRNGEFRDHTYSEPKKWMKGKGRVTIQFGCCYNYATDKDNNPPGILRHVAADPLPSLFVMMIRRLVRWHIIPLSCIPDSCIVNIYEPGDCIPPHIDSHDFDRPFCTLSFLSECNILFGSDLKAVAPGEFSGSAAIPLPVGSVLVLNGNGANIAKHCVPAVPAKRISITFRKMDQKLHPYRFKPEVDLQNIEPFPFPYKSNVDARAERKTSDEEGSSQQWDWERFDATKLDASRRKVRRHATSSDSPRYIPEHPSSSLYNAKKRRQLEGPVHRDRRRTRL